MKMTMDEFLAWPHEMRLEEWEKILQERNRIKNKIRRLSIERDDLTDALDIYQTNRDLIDIRRRNSDLIR